MTARKPTSLKLIEGTARPDRAPKREAQPARGVVPSPPSYLVAEGKVEWRRVARELHRIGLLSTVDRASFAGYCQAYGRWVRAERALQRAADRDPVTQGILIKTSNGNVVQSPLVGAANRALELMLKASQEFGMTPASRSGIETDPLVTTLPGGAATRPAASTSRDGPKEAAASGADRFFSH